RRADAVRARDLERLEDARRVVGHFVDRVRARRLRAPADAPVVERDGAVAAGKIGDLEQPRARVGGEPHDEEERVAAPLLLVVELDRADFRRAHCSNQPCMTWANIMSPVSFSLPVMKACMPFSLPVTRRRKSAAWIASVTRAGPDGPFASSHFPPAIFSW